MSAWVLIPLAKHKAAIFFVSPGTEKLNKSPQADKKIILTCCTSLTIKLVLNSESLQTRLNS